MASKIQFKCSTTSPKTREEVEVSIKLPANAALTDISCNLQGPDSRIERLKIGQIKEGLHKSWFVPKYVGTYNLDVRYRGTQCANSPAMILVAPRGELKETIVGRPKFDKPHDIVEFGDGFVITNKGNHEVIITDQAGNVLNKFIQPSLSKSQSFEPFAVNVHNETILVSDLDNGRVIVYDKDGKGFKEIGGEHQLYRPTGVTVDDEGKIYVADDQLGSVRVFDKDNNLIRTIGWEGSNPGELNKPWFIALNSKRQLVVADCQNCRIQIFNSITGELVNCFKVQLDGRDMNVRGLTLDKNDVIYITAITKKRVPFKKVECAMVYTAMGDFIGEFGSGFFFPRGIRVMEKGGEMLAYIVDGAHDRIAVYVL